LIIGRRKFLPAKGGLKFESHTDIDKKTVFIQPLTSVYPEMRYFVQDPASGPASSREGRAYASEGLARKLTTDI